MPGFEESSEDSLGNLSCPTIASFSRTKDGLLARMPLLTRAGHAFYKYHGRPFGKDAASFFSDFSRGHQLGIAEFLRIQS